MAQAVTPHSCTVVGQTQCEGIACGDNASGDRYNGVCDKDGCDWNPWRMGDQTFFGKGSNFKVDSSKKMTVVTQFLTTDGTDSGDLSEIRRFFVQDGKKINMSPTTIPDFGTFDSITDKFCMAQKTWFNDTNSFKSKGGLAAVGRALDRGMVLVMSLWDDHDVDMLWLDSDYPTAAPSSQPGISRGPCSTSSGKPADVESQYPDATVKYSNIKFGEIGRLHPHQQPRPQQHQMIVQAGVSRLVWKCVRANHQSHTKLVLMFVLRDALHGRAELRNFDAQYTTLRIARSLPYGFQMK